MAFNLYNYISGSDKMRIAEAISKRILKLCNDENISINKLAIMSGLTQSTIQSVISGKSKNPKILTIVRICDTFKITLDEFFKDDLFKNIDTEL